MQVVNFNVPNGINAIQVVCEICTTVTGFHVGDGPFPKMFFANSKCARHGETGMRIRRLINAWAPGVHQLNWLINRVGSPVDVLKAYADEQKLL